MSGLILLVIVGAWLAVLVPMALRSHDAGRALSTVDKFHDAMRVLSRREGLVGASGPGPDGPPPGPRPPRPPGTSAPRPRGAAPTTIGVSLAVRRRRVLLGLVATAAVTLVAGLLGPRWVLGVHALADLLALAFVVHLRHQQVQRTARRRRDARRARTSATHRPATREAPTTVRYAAPARVAGIPDRMPPRPAPVPADVPLTAEPSPAPVPVRGAVGEPWAPVPVPLPGYVTAPAAPRAALDGTRPGGWSDGVTGGQRGTGTAVRGGAPDEVLERRRAAGDW